MADRIITVTEPSVVTNDTLSGYNNYSDIDGQLGTTMTPTEATNGKTVTLSDGSTHQVTTKPVGATSGEFTGVVSNAVEVDLSTAEWVPLSGTATNVDMTENSPGNFTGDNSNLAGTAVSASALFSGDFEFRMLWDNNVADTAEGNGRNMGLFLDTVADTEHTINTTDYAAYRTSGDLTVRENGVGEGPSEGVPTEEGANTGDEFLRLKRVGSIISLYYDNGAVETLVHNFPTQTSADLYLIVKVGSGFTARNCEYK